MNTRTVTISAALVILFFQLISLEVSLPVGNVSHGTIGERVRETFTLMSAKLQATRYTAARTETHDSMVFVGDVMLARNVEVLMDREGVGYPFAGLTLDLLAPNSAIVGNFEASMALPHVPTPALHMRFSVAEKNLAPLREAGFTHLSLANNHSLDYGVEGYENTVSLLQQHSLSVFGHNQTLGEHSISYVKTPRGTVALIGINASQQIPSKRDLTFLLNEAGKESDLQIAYVHWGEEYEPIHSRAQELLATELVAGGIDLIVGHHPHVVQDIDVVNGVVVFYSLGNYVFDQYFEPEVMEGLVLSLDFTEDPVVTLLPVGSSAPLSQPTLMEQKRHQDFLLELSSRSHADLKETIKAGYVPLTNSVATSSKMAIMMP
jgi:gamma-polyglutamate biosynthesis protein CapA